MVEKQTFENTVENWFANPELLELEASKHICRASGGGIPGFEIRERIARGGQGVVFAACDRATGASVAIKVLSEGPLRSAIARRRFEREAEIIAALEHPNIVPILSKGTTADGRPYLVMPRLDGQTLDDWAAQQRATQSIDKIVVLFGKLSEAVHFAHQHGVIHRDLKPSNILIDENDEPKILDFGLAKQPFLGEFVESESPSVTQEGQFVGSVQWTSPEQLTGNVREIDIRTDVYAIGVMFYHALTGEFPYPVEGALPAVIHGVMNVAPPRPSGIAAHLGADIDAIALKALAKSPLDRYQTTGEFASDLKSFLRSEPISARREQARRTLQRNVRRYQAITLVSATLLALSTIMYFRASADRDRAEREAAKAKASADFLQNLFAGVDPWKRGLDVTVAEMLDQAATALPTQFENQPDVRAALEHTIGYSYALLGLHEKAAPHLHRAWSIRREVFGDFHLDTARSALHVANSGVDFSADRYRLLRDVVREFQLQLGTDHPDTLLAERYLISTLPAGTSDVEVLAHFRDLNERATRALPADDRIRSRISAELAGRELQIGKIRDAELLLRNEYDKYTLHPDADHEHRICAARDLGMIFLANEQLGDAEGSLDYAVAAQTRVLGAEHPATVSSRLARVQLWVAQRKLAVAEAELAVLNDKFQFMNSSQHYISSAYKENLARVRAAQLRFEEAIAILDSLAYDEEPQNWVEQWHIGRTRRLLLSTLVVAGECERAVAVAREMMDVGPDHGIADYEYARVQLECGECLLALARADEARSVLESAQAVLLKTFGANHSLSRRAEKALASLRHHHEKDSDTLE